MEKAIPLFAPTYEIDECLAEIRECLEIGWTGLGFKTVQFEEAWKAYTRLAHAHFLNSATAGLELALKLYKEALGWKDGDEVITTPLTFVSTNHAILHERLTPVFADVDRTLCLSPESVERSLTARTRAVLYVGLGGNAGRLGRIRDLCRRKNLKLILDASHMAGTSYEGAHAGSGIDCSVFSFQAVKNLPIADAGMICFSALDLDAKARVMSWLGIDKDTYSRTKGNGYDWHYDVEDVGVKAHGCSLLAAVGLVQLKYLERDNARRRELAGAYEALLHGKDRIAFVEYLPDCVPSRHLFQIRVAAALRDPLVAVLRAKKIHAGVHYRANTHYKMYRDALGRCPEAERAGEELISLPLHLRLTKDDVAYVCESILAFLAGRSAARSRKAA